MSPLRKVINTVLTSALKQKYNKKSGMAIQSEKLLLG